MLKSLHVLNKTHTFVPSDILNKHADKIKTRNKLGGNQNGNKRNYRRKKRGLLNRASKKHDDVKELIDVLSEYDEDAKVYLSHDNGYTYGGIRYGSFSEQETEE